MNKKNVLLIVIMAVILLIAVGLTVYIVHQQQTVRSNASSMTPPVATQPNNNLAQVAAATATPTPPTLTPTPTSAAGTGGAACTAPGAVQGVNIIYPYCPGGAGCTADLTKAQCTWTAVPGATSYSVKILHVNNDATTSPVQSDTVTTGTSDVFPITQDNTYECDVSAVNACGSGVVGQIQQLCAASAPLVTATPSVIPTVAPTTPLVQGPKPTLPATGGSSASVIMLGVGGVAITIIGGFLLLL